METVVNDANFDEVVSSSRMVVVDFWAPWCGPCRALAPVISEIAAEYEGRITVAKCNVDDCEEVPFKYGIRNIPTLIYFKGGEPVERSVGAIMKSEIKTIIDNLLQ